MNQLELTAFVTFMMAVIPGHMSAQTCGRQNAVVFEHANVLTMNASEVLRDQTVVVSNGRIERIAPDAQAPQGSCRIDARGKFLLPGLSDMHAHITEADLPLFLANGVTLVREMNGSASHLAMRDRLANHELIGPRLVVASTLMTGKPLQFRHKLVTSASDAYAAAHEARDAGYSFLKIYDDLSIESYDAFVKAATNLGLRLDGHVPSAVGLERVLAAGQSIQHMDKIANGLGGHVVDAAMIARARTLFTGKSSWVTPTLASLYALGNAGSAEYRARLEAPETKYVDPGLVGWWKSLAGARNRPDGVSQYFLQLAALAKAIKAVGTRMLVGTDASNPLMIAGYSVHDEMDAMVKYAGFTTVEVLTAATVNASAFLDDSTGGRVRAGARADLLLVDHNPIDSLTTLRKPAGVMVDGNWFDRAALDAGLRKAVRTTGK